MFWSLHTISYSSEALASSPTSSAKGCLDFASPLPTHLHAHGHASPQCTRPEGRVPSANHRTPWSVHAPCQWGLETPWEKSSSVSCPYCVPERTAVPTPSHHTWSSCTGLAQLPASQVPLPCLPELTWGPCHHRSHPPHTCFCAVVRSRRAGLASGSSGDHLWSPRLSAADHGYSCGTVNSGGSGTGNGTRTGSASGHGGQSGSSPHHGGSGSWSGSWNGSWRSSRRKRRRRRRRSGGCRWGGGQSAWALALAPHCPGPPTTMAGA